jgi:hypothetical protein
MSYEEKGQWVYLAVTSIAYGVYVVLVVTSAGATPLTEVDYQPILLPRQPTPFAVPTAMPSCRRIE